MADTSYGVNHPLAVKVWKRKLAKETTKAMWFSKFMGTGKGSIIQEQEELRKGPGDRVRVGLRMQLTGAGVQGDSTLEGNEESLTTYYDDLLINQLRHAVVSGGKMSEQRVPFSVREEAKDGLVDWWAVRDEVAIANQLCGNTEQTNTAFTGHNATTAPSANNLFVGGSETTEASLSAASTHGFKLALLDKAVARAKTMQGLSQPPIRPVRVDGKEYFVAFIHPYQTLQLRQDTATGTWQDIQKSALQGNGSADNPLFSGALGIYNGVVLHECPYLPSLTIGGSGTGLAYRAVLCGAQAAMWGTGGDGADSSTLWTEEMFDYGNKLGVSAGRIYGCKKTIFNSKDFGVITMATYSPGP